MSTLSARSSTGRIGALVRHFSSVDLRSLGLLRLVLGALLVVDLRDRFRVVDVLYSNDGVLSNHFSLFRPLAPFQFSIYVGSSSSREASVAFAATLFIYLLFAVGYRTRLFHILSFVCVTSLHARNLMTEVPGDVPLHLWMAWSLFLPLGARFSVDALRRPPASRPEMSPVSWSSIAVFGMLLQLSAMHLFAAVRQAGTSWQDGTAIYYALRQSLWVTDFGAWIGQHVSAADLRTASFAYRALEFFIGVLVLVPGATARRASMAALVAFHMGSRLLWNVGTYEWVMLGAVPLLVSSRDWEILGSWYRDRTRRLTVHFAPIGVRVAPRVRAIRAWFGINRPDEVPRTVPAIAFDESARRCIARAVTASREGAACLFLFVCGVALARDMGDEIAPPGPEAAIYRIVAYPRLFQRWGLFAPDPPKRPGTLVAEAETVSGARVDPLSGQRRPDPLMAAYFTSISQPSRSVYVSELREYVRRVGDQRSPSDRLVWFNVDWVEAPIAAPEPEAEMVALSPVSRRITSGP